MVKEVVHLLFLSCHNDDVVCLNDEGGVGIGVEVFGGSNKSHDDAVAFFTDARLDDALAAEG